MQQGSNVNTILIVILILVVAGFGFFWYTNRVDRAADQNDAALQINLGGSSDSKTDN
ncbi:MAG TPA: hypothetical protein VGE35_04120 [Candidatus Paceibacterota bacterium]